MERNQKWERYWAFVTVLLIFIITSTTNGQEDLSLHNWNAILSADLTVTDSFEAATIGPADEKDEIECKEYHDIDADNYSMKCDFIKTTDDCHIDDGFVNYLMFAYCNFLPNTLPLAFIILGIWLIFLFVSLGVTAGQFFCPALTELSRALKLSQSFAGVTLLAFGNGAPDIFSAIAASRNGETDLVIGALFGAAIFITTVVAGSVAFAKPFQLEKGPFLRDAIFLLGAGLWTFTIFLRGEIRTGEAIGFICLYFGYVLVVIIGKKISEHPRCGQNTPLDICMIEEDDESRQLVESAAHMSDDIQEERGAICKLLHSLNPIETQDWQAKSLMAKSFSIFKMPVQFLLQLTVPKVDYNADMHGWNKLLNVLQVLISPMFSLLITELAFKEIAKHFYVWMLMLPVCVLIAVIVFFTSESDEPPIYHFLFPYLAFFVSVVWIYTLANEIINLLLMFGIVFDLSTTFLGLTLLAWGNCIGDLVADLTIARQGFPRMAFAACFGGPLFNILLGIGISCTIAAGKDNGVFHVSYDVIHIVLVAVLALSLISSIIFMLYTRFNTTRLYAVFLYTVYLGFLIIPILKELKVIK